MSDVAFPAEGTVLLRELSDHNDREWFAAHKQEIEANVLQPAHEVRQMLSEHLGSRFGGAFDGKVYRLHRDLRFSKDKRPYTPYVRLSVLRAGDDCRHVPALHVSFEPDSFKIGAGIWEFAPEKLERFRQGLLSPEQRHDLDALLSRLSSSGASIPEPELSRLPKGISATVDSIHFRRKGLTAWCESPNAAIPAAVRNEEILERVETLLPLFKWLDAV
jgi:uncharacterized protein (TIGR02453 family)